MKLLLKKLFLLLAILFLLAGCARTAPGPIAEAVSLYSGNLSLADHQDAPPLIFVDARDVSGSPLAFSEKLELALAGDSLNIVNNPSKAGYILHINIIQEGKVDQAVLKKLVEDGYGAKALFAGEGSNAILADTLLVQRRVPKAKRPSRARLKNISTRNALESARMRIAIILERQNFAHGSAHDALISNLGHALREQIGK